MGDPFNAVLGLSLLGALVAGCKDAESGSRGSVPVAQEAPQAVGSAYPRGFHDASPPEPTASAEVQAVGRVYLEPAPNDASSPWPPTTKVRTSDFGPSDLMPGPFAEVRSSGSGAQVSAACRPLVDLPVVNEVVSVTIDGNGKVVAADARGNSPVVGRCVEGQLRRWVFPATGMTTQLNIPFHWVQR